MALGFGGNKNSATSSSSNVGKSGVFGSKSVSPAKSTSKPTNNTVGKSGLFSGSSTSKSAPKNGKMAQPSTQVKSSLFGKTPSKSTPKVEEKPKTGLFGKKDTEPKTEKKEMKGVSPSTPKKSGKIGTVVTLGKEGYENNVAKRALERAGKNPNLRGHVNEIRTVDQFNSKIENILTGKKAKLTKSKTAMRDDIVVLQKGKVIKRFQLKDVLSKGGMEDTVKKVGKGQYQRTNLVGTKETAEKFAETVTKKNAKGGDITQKMSSNNLSSVDNQRIADLALGGNVLEKGKEIAKGAKGTSQKSALIAGGKELIFSAKKVYDGDMTIKEAATNAGKEALISGTSSAAGDAAGTAATIGLMATPAAPVAPAVGMATSVVVSNATDKGLRKMLDSNSTANTP